VRNRITKKVQIHLLLNVEDLTSSPTPNQRGFLLQPEIMDGINNAVMATFYDLYENGIQDVILVNKPGANEHLKIGAFTNLTQDSDAYFVKVIVLSGNKKSVDKILGILG
jgi:hypothetical protein